MLYRLINDRLLSLKDHLLLISSNLIQSNVENVEFGKVVVKMTR